MSSSSRSAGPAHERPGERDALALTAGQADAALADDRVEAVGGLGDEASARARRSASHSSSSSMVVAEHEVLADRAGEEERLLEHDGPRTRHRWRPCPTRAPPGRRRPGPAWSCRRRSDRRRRRCARRATSSDDVAQRRRGSRRRTCSRRRRARCPGPARRRAIGGHRIGLDRLVEHLAHAPPAGQRVRQLGQRVADQAQREHEQREQVDEAGQLADGEVAALDAGRAEQRPARRWPRRERRRAAPRTCPRRRTAPIRAVAQVGRRSPPAARSRGPRRRRP